MRLIYFQDLFSLRWIQIMKIWFDKVFYNLMKVCLLRSWRCEVFCMVFRISSKRKGFILSFSPSSFFPFFSTARFGLLLFLAKPSPTHRLSSRAPPFPYLCVVGSMAHHQPSRPSVSGPLHFSYARKKAEGRTRSGHGDPGPEVCTPSYILEKKGTRAKIQSCYLRTG